jgi:adhesin transport system outer membrane protein
MRPYGGRAAKLLTSALCSGALALALTAFAGAPAGAQSLQDAVALAIDAHPVVRGSEASFRASERAVEQERGAYLPSVDVTGDTGYQRSDQEDVSESDRDLWRGRYRVSGTQLLFDGLETPNRIDAAKRRADAARFDVEGSANEIARRTVNAYLAVARDRELVELALENVDLHRGILGDVREAAEAGGGSNADVSQVSTRLSFAESQLRRLRGDLANSEADFREAVGQSPADVTRPAPPLAAIPDSLDQAIAVARSNNPERNASIEESRAASEEADAALGNFFPTFDVELAHEGRRGVSGEPDYETDSTALLRMRWNLFNGGADTAARRRAMELDNEARLRTREVDRLIREEMEVGYNNLYVALDQRDILVDRVRTAREVTGAYQEQFRLNQRTVLDLLDSGNELFVARVDLTRVEYEVIRSAYGVLATAGTLLETVGVAPEIRDVDAVPSLELESDDEWLSE